MFSCKNICILFDFRDINTYLSKIADLYTPPVFVEDDSRKFVATLKAVVTCKIKDLQKCYENVLVFCFTCNHGLSVNKWLNKWLATRQ